MFLVFGFIFFSLVCVSLGLVKGRVEFRRDVWLYLGLGRCFRGSRILRGGEGFREDWRVFKEKNGFYGIWGREGRFECFGVLWREGGWGEDDGGWRIMVMVL